MPMRELLAAWRRVRGIIEEVEDLHGRIATARTPTVPDVLVPLAYRHLCADARRDTPDAVIGIAGHYLSQRYPELREYLLTPEQRDRLQGLRAEIDALLTDEAAPHDPVRDGAR